MMESFLLGLCGGGLINGNIKFEIKNGKIYVDIEKTKETYCISCEKIHK